MDGIKCLLQVQRYDGSVLVPGLISWDFICYFCYLLGGGVTQFKVKPIFIQDVVVFKEGVDFLQDQELEEFAKKLRG